MVVLTTALIIASALGVSAYLGGKIADVLGKYFGTEQAKVIGSDQNTCISALQQVGRTDLVNECFETSQKLTTQDQSFGISDIMSFMPFILMIMMFQMVKK